MDFLQYQNQRMEMRRKYEHVIDETIKSLRATFLDNNLTMDDLAKLRKLWLNELVASYEVVQPVECSQEKVASKESSEDLLETKNIPKIVDVEELTDMEIHCSERPPNLDDVISSEEDMTENQTLNREVEALELTYGVWEEETGTIIFGKADKTKTEEFAEADLAADEVFQDADVDEVGVLEDVDVTAGEVLQEADVTAGEVFQEADVDEVGELEYVDATAGEVLQEADVTVGDVFQEADVTAGEVFQDADVDEVGVLEDVGMTAGEVFEDSDDAAGEVVEDSDDAAGEVFEEADVAAVGIFEEADVATGEVFEEADVTAVGVFEETDVTSRVTADEIEVCEDADMTAVEVFEESDVDVSEADDEAGVTAYEIFEEADVPASEAFEEAEVTGDGVFEEGDVTIGFDQEKEIAAKMDEAEMMDMEDSAGDYLWKRENDSSESKLDDDVECASNEDDAVNWIIVVGDGNSWIEGSLQDDDDDNSQFDTVDPAVDGMGNALVIEQEINSDDDVTDFDDEVWDPEKTDVGFCVMKKLTRTRDIWKMELADGILQIKGKDYVFTKAVGEAKW